VESVTASSTLSLSTMKRHNALVEPLRHEVDIGTSGFQCESCEGCATCCLHVVPETEDQGFPRRTSMDTECDSPNVRWSASSSSVMKLSGNPR